MTDLEKALARIAILEDELGTATERASRAEKRAASSERQASKDTVAHRIELERISADVDQLFGELSARLVADAAKGMIEAAGGSAALLLPIVIEQTRVDRKTREIRVIDEEGHTAWAFADNDIKPASSRRTTPCNSPSNGSSRTRGRLHHEGGDATNIGVCPPTGDLDLAG